MMWGPTYITYMLPGMMRRILPAEPNPGCISQNLEIRPSYGRVKKLIKFVHYMEGRIDVFKECTRKET